MRRRGRRLIEQVIHDPPPPPRKVDPRMPRDLETIVLKAIAKEPARAVCDGGGAGGGPGELPGGPADRGAAERLAERAWRWCRRNTAAAGLLAASAVAALALVGVRRGFVDQRRSSATKAWCSLEAASSLELKSEVDARASEATIRYFNNMLMAEREWSDSNVGRAEQLLDECMPNPGERRPPRLGVALFEAPVPYRPEDNPRPDEAQAMGVAFSPDDRHIATIGL